MPTADAFCIVVMKGTAIVIVGGQQRTDTLAEFFDGKFKMFTLEDKSSRFPSFLLEKPCPWGKVFDQLGQESKDRFVKGKIPVAVIDAEDGNDNRLTQGVAH